MARTRKATRRPYRSLGAPATMEPITVPHRAADTVTRATTGQMKGRLQRAGGACDDSRVEAEEQASHAATMLLRRR